MVSSTELVRLRSSSVTLSRTIVLSINGVAWLPLECLISETAVITIVSSVTEGVTTLSSSTTAGSSCKTSPFALLSSVVKD